MASFPILEITDGTTTVSLIGPFFKLESWRPAIAQAKGGGTWQSSPLADGRRLVNRRFDNTIETFDLSASATTQDSWAHQYQELERLLEKAVEYWTTAWQNTPVYLVAKTPCETETRYALIYSYALPDINQVFREPFASKSPGMVGFSLSLERGHWLADPPGDETCVEISGVDASGYGRDATCDAEVFIANKHNYKALTHIWYDDAGVGFSANLLGSALPQTLLPAVPAVGDILYFGIEDGPLSTITGGGPFFSLVFDLVTAQTGLTFGNGWEYWNSGAGWTTLTVKDNTDTAEPLDTTGVNSVHWEVETAWITNLVNGIVAYWVRLEVTAIAGPAPPVQQNRDIYTINWPYIEVDSDQVEGDITALLRVLLNNQGHYSAFASISRIIMSLRSTSRGLDFTPFLNCSDQQEIPGISCAVGANSAFVTSVVAPTERVVRYTPLATETAVRRCGWTFNAVVGATPIISDQWQGSYHAFVRVTANTVDTFSISLRGQIGDHIYYSSGGAVAVAGSLDMEVIDLGRIDLPDGTGVLLPTDKITIALDLYVSAASGGAGEAIDLFDLVLMPTDEMILDANSANPDDAVGWILDNNTCTFDSVRFPKSVVRTFVKDSNDVIGGVWNTKGPLAFLQSNQDQRLWFLMTRYRSGGQVALVDLALRMQAFANRRYLSLRGER